MAEEVIYEDIERALPTVQPQRQAPALMQEMSVQQVVERIKKIKDIQGAVMKPKIHYGIIPGTPKPSLWKPGAELLLTTFMLGCDYSSQVYDRGNGHREVVAKCVLYHAPTKTQLGSGEGSCSTLEKKYARKKGGDLRTADELPDFYNTVLKMADKRALIAAVLNVLCASEIFTQDLEDLPKDDFFNDDRGAGAGVSGAEGQGHEGNQRGGSTPPPPDPNPNEPLATREQCEEAMTLIDLLEKQQPDEYAKLLKAPNGIEIMSWTKTQAQKRIAKMREVTVDEDIKL